MFRRLPFAWMLLVGLSFAAALRADEPKDFTVALIPDTQFYSLQHPETYSVQTRWIANRAEPDNIRFSIHLGDIVHNNTEAEWKAADKAQKILEGRVPHSIVPGNHDMLAKGNGRMRGNSFYQQYFPPSRYEGKYDWYGGHMGETNDNNYCFFEGGGMKFMVVSLEFAPSNAAIEWANRVIADHPEHRTILATHAYMDLKGRMKAPGIYGLKDSNCGEAMWQNLARKHANVFMVVCGHISGVFNQESKNDAGGRVLEILTDYQGLARGGDGWLRTLRFSPSDKKIYVKAYSPLIDQTNEDPKHTLSIDYDFAADFVAPAMAEK